MTDNLPTISNAVEAAGADGFYQLRLAITAIEDQANNLAEQGDVDSLAVGYAQLKDIIGDLRLVLQTVESHIIENSGDKAFLVEGVGQFEIMRKSPSRRWDSLSLLSRIVREAVVDKDTGELPTDDEMAAVQRVVDAVTTAAPFTSSLGWRVTALRNAGIDIDDYCESSANPGFSLKFLDNR